MIFVLLSVPTHVPKTLREKESELFNNDVILQVCKQSVVKDKGHPVNMSKRRGAA
jgi:hypothetical protein